MSLSCLYHRWIADRRSEGDGGVPDSLQRHADSCPRCAAYTQRLRALDSRFRTVRGAGDETFPGGLHGKIMAAVREVQMEKAHAVSAPAASSRNWRGLFVTCFGAAAAIAFLVVALNHFSGQVEPDAPAVVATETVTPEKGVETPAEKETPEKSGLGNLFAAVPNVISPKAELKNQFVPAATRRVAEFTGELPSLLVSKVSEPYASEMELLGDDLSAATNFLSACLFVNQAPTDL